MASITKEVQSFVGGHSVQILMTIGLVTYSLAKNKLTPGGIIAAVATAVVHMLHPWSVFFYLLVSFFAIGTIATKANHAAKALITQSSAGGSGAEGPRNYAQVLANSGTASLLILYHLYISSGNGVSLESGFKVGDIIPIGIIASYAAATADTISSELGILATTPPRLITTPWVTVPKGTNGGVTAFGVIAGLLGSAILSVIAVLLLPFVNSTTPFPSSLEEISTLLSASASDGWTPATRENLGVLLTLSGLCGTLLDSFLGAVAQVTVKDQTSGRIVEGENGKRVLVAEGGSRVSRGLDLLNNNGVNFAMAAGTAVGSMGAAKWFWGV